MGQVLSLTLVFINLKSKALHSASTQLVLGLGFLCLNLSTLVLWQSIQQQAQPKNRPNNFSLAGFLYQSAHLSLVGLVGLVLGFGFRQVFYHWALLTLFSSLLFVSVLGAALFAVLFRASFYKACRMMAALWAKKPGVPTLSAVSLMLSHGLAFVSASIGKNRGLVLERFSVFHSFATIWLLLLVLAGICLAAAVFLNIFLVLGFLELINQNKASDQREIKEELKHPAAEWG